MGGVHVFIGFAILIICTLITVLWIQCIYIVFALCNKALDIYRVYRDRSRAALNGVKIVNFRFALKVFLLILIFNIILFKFYRNEWHGEGNAHYKAKEYWIAGQVVYTYRKNLGRFLHPENLILRPYTYLQEKIYDQGIKYLPAEDGEKYVWYNEWFLYPYSINLALPYDVGYWHAEPKMVSLLDSCWQCMEGLMTKRIEDKGMHKKFLLSFPALASYYSTYQGYYTGKFNRSGRKIRTNPFYSKRNLIILGWLDELHEKWMDEGYIEEIWQKYPFVANCWQLDITDLLHRIALWLPTEGTFSCEHPIVLRMYEQFQVNMSDAPDKNAILNLQRINNKQARLSYEDAVYSAQASAGRYLLTEVCGKNMPSEKTLFHKQAAALDRFKMNSYEVNHVFREELKPLSSEEN